MATFLTCSVLYLARVSVWYSKLPCAQIALPFMSVSYPKDVPSVQNRSHYYVSCTWNETVRAALRMCLEIQKVRIQDGDWSVAICHGKHRKPINLSRTLSRPVDTQKAIVLSFQTTTQHVEIIRKNKHTHTLNDTTLNLWIVTLAEQQMQYFTLCGHCTTKCS